MAKEFAKSFYRSKAWQQCRASYIKSVGGLCETCSKNGEIIPGKILHHKIILTPNNINNPDVTLNWDNLEYECKSCHDKHEGHGLGKDKKQCTREGLKFNEKGELIEV